MDEIQQFFFHMLMQNIIVILDEFVMTTYWYYLQFLRSNDYDNFVTFFK